VVAITSGPLRPLLECAALNVFWTLPKTLLCKLAKYLGVEHQQKDSLVQVLAALVKDQLKCNDAKLAEVLSLRLMKLQAPSDELIIDTDDFKDLLDESDQKDLQKDDEWKSAREAQAKSFSSEVCRLRSQARQQLPKKGKVSKPVAHPLSRLRFPPEVPNKGSTTREEAQLCSPPDCNILLDDFNARWRATFRLPVRSLSRSWLAHGYDESLTLVLRWAWGEYLVAEGLPESACPFPRLFGGLAPASAIRPGASASSSGL
jgi:hypothetical protein